MEPRIVEVELNLQQMELVERFCEEEGLADPAAALRFGLRAYLADQAGVEA
jgi:hypothetical protein